MDWPEWTNRYLFFIKSFAYLFRKHVNVGLVDVSAFIDKGNRIVDLDVRQFFRFLLPVFIQNEQ